MRRGRIFIYLALVLLVSLAGVFLYMQQNKPPTGDEVASGPVLIEIVYAKQNIPQGTTITEDVLGSMSIPDGENFEVMFRYDERKEKVVGKVARYTLEPGVVITKSMIGNAGDVVSDGPEWANKISPGMTAVSIPITRLSSVAYGASEGAHVNVVACFIFVDVDSGFQSVTPNQTAFVSQSGFIPSEAPSLSASVSAGQTSEQSGAAQGRVELDPTFQQPIYIVPSESQRPRPVCQTIIQDVSVLKLGDFPIDGKVEKDTSEDEDAPPDDEDAAPKFSSVISLIVTPQDATSLIYLAHSGRVKLILTLRGANDTTRVETEAATLQFLLSQYAIPVPAKLPYAFEPRLDFYVDIPLKYTDEWTEEEK